MVDEIRDQNQVVRKLGWKYPSQHSRLMRAAQVSIQDYRRAAGFKDPLIPREKWVERSFVKNAPLSLIEDQRQYGSCTCATATGAGNRQRWIRGQPIVPLAWTWLYDQINDGSDNGSNIGDADEVVRTQGVPPMSSYTKCIFKSGHNPTGVLYYKEDVEVTFTEFDDYATGILMGILGQFPLDAGGKFERFDGDGISQGTGSNPNHSVYCAGLRKVGGVWVLEGVNSWTPNWGPFKNGTWLATEKQINNCAHGEDGRGHASTLDPTNAVPAPTV